MDAPLFFFSPSFQGRQLVEFCIGFLGKRAQIQKRAAHSVESSRKNLLLGSKFFVERVDPWRREAKMMSELLPLKASIHLLSFMKMWS